MERTIAGEDWSVSTICWYAVFIWFGASLFSQSLYMALNGSPYDANMMLDSIGVFAWFIIGVELLVWVFLALALGGKFVNRFNVSTKEITSPDNISPQA